jgi:hypothetical protein
VITLRSATAVSLVPDSVLDGAGRVSFLADLTTQTGVSLQGVILAICGTILGALIAIRALAAWAEDKYGKMATLILAGAVVAGFCYFPAESMAMLKSLYTSATSGTTPAPVPDPGTQSTTPGG